MKNKILVKICNEGQLQFLTVGCEVYFAEGNKWDHVDRWYDGYDIRNDDGASPASDVLSDREFYVEEQNYKKGAPMSENKAIDLKCKSCDANIFHLREKLFVNGTMHVEAVCAACEKHYQYVSQAPREFADDAKPLEELKMPFGKHKGVLLSECPKDYLQWASDNLTSGFVIKIKEFLAKYP